MKFHGKAKVSGDLDAFGAQYACIGSLAARAKGHAQETSIFLCAERAAKSVTRTQVSRRGGVQGGLNRPYFRFLPFYGLGEGAGAHRLVGWVGF